MDSVTSRRSSRHRTASDSSDQHPVKKTRPLDTENTVPQKRTSSSIAGTLPERMEDIEGTCKEEGTMAQKPAEDIGREPENRRKPSSSTESDEGSPKRKKLNRSRIPVPLISHIADVSTRSAKDPDIRESVTDDTVSKEEASSLGEPVFTPDRAVTRAIEKSLRKDTFSPHRLEPKATKRRSSFVSGRVLQPSALPTSASDLSRDIPTDLPAAQRLEILHKNTLQYTLAKLQEEFPDLQGMQQFQVHVNDAMNTAYKKLREDGEFEKATHKDKYLPHPENIQMDEVIQAQEAYIKKLKTEGEEWDKLLENRKSCAHEAEECLENVSEDPIPAISDLIPQEQRDFLASKPDLQTMLSRLKEMKEKYILAVDHMHNVSKVISEFSSHAQTYVQQHTQALRETSLKEVSTDPKQLVESALSIS